MSKPQDHSPAVRLRRRARCLPLVVFVAVAAACGSTVQVGQGGAPGGTAPSADGLALAPSSTARGDVGETAQPTTADPGEVPGSAPGSAAATGSAGAASPTGSTGSTDSDGDGFSGEGSGSTSGGGGQGPGRVGGGADDPAQQPPRRDGEAPQTAPRLGPGVSAKEITVGIAIADDSSPGNEEIGLEGVTQGDTERYYEILRSNINRNGGIAGRQMRYSTFRYTTVNATSSGLNQEACEHWTADDRAFVVAGWSSDSGFLACAEQNRLPSTFGYLTGIDEQTLAAFRHHFEPNQINLNRQMRALSVALPSQGYFTRGYKLGVLTFDEAPFERAYTTLKSSLAARGKKISAVERVPPVQRNEDLGRLTAQIQSAVLQFKSDEVSHVVIIDATGLLTLLFTRSAENQAYRPRYGLTSNSGLTTLARSGVPEGQFNNALGIGWTPIIDVPGDEVPKTAAAQRCLAMFKRNGEEPADPNNASIMVGMCQEIDFIKAAVERGRPDITADSFIRGAESLGSRFPAYVGLGPNFFGPRNHDGGAYYAHVKYAADCNCFHYSSKPRLAR